MDPSTAKNQSVARRLALLSLAGLAAVLLAVSIAIGVIEQRSTHALMVTSVADRVQSVVAVADASDQVNRELMLRSYKSFRQDFDPAPTLNEATGELNSFGALVNNDFGAVDKFTRDTGGVATVFAKKGADFLRITTSLKKQDGERALGTLLDRAHPAYKLILAGQSYTGPALLFGKPYMTHYDPIKDAAGAVIGIFFVGNDIGLQQVALEKQIADVRFFETGGIYFIDSPGPLTGAHFAAHPSAKGKKVLEVYPQAEKFLTAIAAAPDGYERNAFTLLGAKQDDKWAVMRKTKAGTGWLVAEVSESESMATYWANMAVIWALLAATTVLLGIGLYLLVRRTVSQPLGELTVAVTAVAQGDLTQVFHTDRQDEIGALVNEVEGMRQRYMQALSQVRASVDSIGTASAEIASVNQDLSVRTEQTASNLQRTASSLEQLTGTVKQSADAARQANQLAASAAEVAARGGAVVGEVVTTMNDINQSSKKIADIISVIDGIAFQTNILALNAAVEAARAGEQGRGFAVVASEVRSLAQRSAEAAKEIKTLIGTSVDKVASGTKLVSDAGSTMSDIVQSVRKVADVIGEITAASAEQSSGIAHVNQAIGNLDQMTQQNAALVEESAAAAESLREQADQLAQAVAVFKISATGMSVTSTPRRPTRDITPRATALPHQRPQPTKPAPALGNSRSSSPARKPLAAGTTQAPAAMKKPLAVAAPVRLAAAKPAPVASRAPDADWESF
ncbi:MAG: Cache 3/Cache 2 fusion domain-containing protein [Rhodoferax sp.]|uniref:methyl-accepting chemotaxis protein n=1 Tax=Rhodoferax sp. TaxID=50421 RepID=UPI0027183B18|nr:Cache 3/Cache 2 fusion domain-containing protein [Rhodoferax sp.]MDO8449997.1 Cache 3/Cache 2 fusion domain-containing protein [Rhodoferax sp.]